VEVVQITPFAMKPIGYDLSGEVDWHREGLRAKAKTTHKVDLAQKTGIVDVHAPEKTIREDQVGNGAGPERMRCQSRQSSSEMRWRVE
jgi:hypothetical protein